MNPLLELHRQADAEFQPYGEIEIVSTFGEPQAEYSAIRKACALLDLPQRGVLELTGKDRLAFLNNLLTNQTWDKAAKSGLTAGRGVYAFLLNLNRVAVLLGIYSNLPWILPAYYTLATWLGARLLRVKVQPRLLRELTAAFADAQWADFRRLAHTLTPLAWAYVLGSTIGAIVLAVIAHRVALAMLIAHRRRLEAHQQSTHNQ